MAVIGIDLGGTKISSALLDDSGGIGFINKVVLNHVAGDAVFEAVKGQIQTLLHDAEQKGLQVEAAGISVPGIYYPAAGTVWAPNIPGWDDYPLLHNLQAEFPGMMICIENDRACYILGEVWKGNARGCKNAVFIAVGTGLAAGILADGKVLQGAHGIAGAIGWMALNKPYDAKYIPVGCAEYYASGAGLERYAREVVASRPGYQGIFSKEENITGEKILAEYAGGDEVAVEVVSNAVEYWGMAVANLVSIFNPEKIVFGGGVFSGEACGLLDDIYREALKWGQPVSMRKVKPECSATGEMAGLYGALYLAGETVKNPHHE